MKKIIALLFLIVLAFSCENSELQVLDRSELRSVLKESKTYDDIVKIASSNIQAVRSFDREELKEFFNLAKKARTEDITALTEFANVCNDIGFSARNIDLIENLMIDLKSKFIFEDDDFQAILNSDIISQLNPINGRVLLLPQEIPCMALCGATANLYRASLDPQIGTTLLDAMRSAYFTGCYECCYFSCGS